MEIGNKIHWSHAISIFNPYESKNKSLTHLEKSSNKETKRKRGKKRHSFIFIDIIGCLVPVLSNKFNLST